MNKEHSINCYFCSALVDERECMPADPYNGNDGGEVCPKCMKGMASRKIVQFALSYLVSNLCHASEIMFDDPALQGVDDEDALEQAILNTQQQIMCKLNSEKCVPLYGGVVLVDGRLNTLANHTDIDVLTEAMANKVCELYGSTANVGELAIAEIVQQLTEHKEYQYKDCVIYIGEHTEIRKRVLT